MASIRKTKKVLKNSKGFLTIVIKHTDHVLAFQEGDYFTSNKYCAIARVRQTGSAFYQIPYKSIKRVNINK